MTWEPGRERIRQLVDDGEIEQVTPDITIARNLLQAQGFRATSKGGHLAVQEAVTAQFGAAVRTFRSFSGIRRTRNAFEYPGSGTPGPAAEDVDDAVKVATEAHSAAGTILDQELLTPW